MNDQPIVMTVCVVHRPDAVLLGLKKVSVGAGLWNGFGGKVEPGESIEAAAVRELAEEVGLTASSVERLGVIDFSFDGTDDRFEVHFFSCREFSGEPVETDEMEPRWFALDDIPYDQMWPDDRQWLPLLLVGKKFRGAFKFNANRDVLEERFEEVDEWR